MAISSLSDLINKATSGRVQDWSVYILPTDTGGGGIGFSTDMWASLWLWDKYSGFGDTPTSVAAPTKDSQGAMPYIDAAIGTNYLLNARFFGKGMAAHWMLYDRLLHIGGLDGTLTSAQTIGGTLTRNTGGVGNFIAVECGAGDFGGTPTTITASYTNQAGTSARTTKVTPIAGYSNDNHRIVFLPLQDGDTGVQAVASVTLAASTGATGVWGVIVGHMLANQHHGDFTDADEMNYNKELTKDINGLVALEDGTCLDVIFFSLNNIETGMLVTYQIVDG